MNEFDSERMVFLLNKKGYTKTEWPQKADLIVFNTCSVRKKAEDRLYGHIGNLKSLKEKKPDMLICVGGCTAQSLGGKLLEEFKHIDIVFGTHNIGNLPKLIDKRNDTGRRICNISESDKFFYDIFNFKRKYSFKAFLPISIGCNNYCSYCIVPYVRGRERSIDPLRIINKIKELAGDGVIEVMLVGQNVNSYGNDFDLSNKKYTFFHLLENVAQIDDLKRIRFITSHPKDFTRELVKTIKDNNNIMNHIHLPLQAGSDKVLKMMNRKYKSKDYIDIYNYIKSKIPDCAITTDIIVGFPGESYDDFKKTLAMVKKLKFNRAFTFMYCPRRGTKAEKFKDYVNISEKKKWFNELLEIQNNISLQENKKLVGKRFKVLVEGKSDRENNQYRARLENNIIVNFISQKNLTGRIVDINIKSAKPFYLSGEITDDNSQRQK